MNPDDITKLMDELTQKFGPAAQHLYDLAVRQATIEGMASLVLGLIAVFIPLTIYIFWARWYWKKEVKEALETSYHSADIEPILLIGLLPLGSIIFGIMILYNAFAWLANPEWRAISVLSGLLPK